MKLRMAMLAAGLLALASIAGFNLSAEATNECPATGQSINPATQSGSVSVSGPAGGVCASGSAATQGGHIWVDGDSANPGPSSGYAHVGNDGAGDPDGDCSTGCDAEPDSDVCVDDNAGPRSGGSSPACQDLPG